MIDSIRSKLTAWYVTVLASVLVVFGVGIYLTLSNVLYVRIDDGGVLRSLRHSSGQACAQHQSKKKAK